MTTLFYSAKDWYMHWWIKIPEPRAYSIIFALAYLGCIGWGTMAFFYPPQTLLGSAGQLTMSLMGLAYVMGGVVGAIGGAMEAWKLERLGIYLVSMGLLSYYVIVLHTAFNSSGYRYAQILVIYLSLLLFSMRLVMIWRYTFKPRVITKEIDILQ